MTKYRKIMLFGEKEPEAWLLCPETPFTEKRPAMLCVPGGGYHVVCMDTEGYPIAERFAELGFRSFILHYRAAPARYPAPQQDILRAIRLIRHHATEWGVLPDALAVCGFSAGGHLCASAGILFDRITCPAVDNADKENGRPDAVLLSYPVVSSGARGHAGSFRNLLGPEQENKLEEVSLEKQVRPDSAPMFLWHTLSDQIVPYENSTLLAEALHRNKVPAELHLFPAGPHGMTLGYGREDIARWPEMAVSFLRGTLGFPLPPPRKRTVVLTFDDCCRTQLQYALPVLQKYGFRATFFFCRFSDEWRTAHPDALMTKMEAKRLCDLGFEIGNHTWSHAHLPELSDAELAQEIERMSAWLREAGCPETVSFAYPGGPYAANAVRLLAAHGFCAARTAEHAAWTKETDLMRIPGYAVSLDDELSFYSALEQAENGASAVLVYHGIPDEAHPHCSNTPEFFERNMKYLHDNGYEVISMREQLARYGRLPR